jgi:hypothetical protein
MVPNLSSDEQAADDYLADALIQLHETTHPKRQPGEFCVAEYAAANKMDLQQADNELRRMVRSGKVTKAGQRFIDERMRSVYKLV